MKFNLKKKDDKIKIYYEYEENSEIRSGEITSKEQELDVEHDKTLNIWGCKESNKVDTSLTITSNCVKCFELKLIPKKPSGNHGNEGNGDEPVVNVEIGGV